MEVAAEESFGQGSALRPLLGFYSADLIIHVTVSLEFEIMFLVTYRSTTNAPSLLS